MLVLPVIVCQVAPYLLSRCRVGWDEEKCMLYYFVLVQKEACESQFVVLLLEWIIIWGLFIERERKRERVSAREREIMCVTERKER